jgi:hypothetical protein
MNPKFYVDFRAEGVLFSYFFFVSHHHDFFYFVRHSSLRSLLFQGNNGVGFGRVKVFAKNTTRSLRRCGDFLQNPQGLTFTRHSESVNTFAREQ